MFSHSFTEIFICLFIVAFLMFHLRIINIFLNGFPFSFNLFVLYFLSSIFLQVKKYSHLHLLQHSYSTKAIVKSQAFGIVVASFVLVIKPGDTDHRGMFHLRLRYLWLWLLAKLFHPPTTASLSWTRPDPNEQQSSATPPRL